MNVVGIAKGAAMLSPKLATMLAVVLTDAPLDPQTADRMLRDAVDRSFNCISIDAHTSTNDAVLMLASGAAGVSGESVDLDALAMAAREVCVDLAKAIVSDAEGGGHLVTIDVEDARTADDARRIARSIADSPLLKTALHGADPNWGRIISAAGNAGMEFEEQDLTLWLNGVLLYKQGDPVAFDERGLSNELRANFDVHIRLLLNQGTAKSRFWACDLTAEYIRLNTEYPT